MSLSVEDDVTVTIDAGLAYRDDLMSEWTRKFHSVEQRPLRCIFGVPKVKPAINTCKEIIIQLVLVASNGPCFCRRMKMKVVFITATPYHSWNWDLWPTNTF